MTAVAAPPRTGSLELKVRPGEVRVLDHLLTEAIDCPEKFGANEEDEKAAKAKRSLIETARALRKKLGLSVPARRVRRPAAPEPAPAAPAPAPEPLAAAPEPAAAGAVPTPPEPTPEPAPAAPVSAAAVPPPAPVAAEPVPAAAPAKKAQVHFLIIYSTKGRGKTLVENGDFDSFKEAWAARITASANPVWRSDDILIEVISGPSRDVLTRTHPKYFSRRPPRTVSTTY